MNAECNHFSPAPLLSPLAEPPSSLPRCLKSPLDVSCSYPTSHSALQHSSEKGPFEVRALTSQRKVRPRHRSVQTLRVNTKSSPWSVGPDGVCPMPTTATQTPLPPFSPTAPSVPPQTRLTSWGPVHQFLQESTLLAARLLVSA